MTSPDLGLFGPGSVSWKIHDEPVMWLAGLRSLYLQALHPRAMAGLAQNSRYKQDPWARLMRTSRYIGTVIYGTTEQAHAAGAHVRRIHGRLRAVDPRTGDLFRVDEPALLRWVHVTEVESFLTTAVRAGVPLAPTEIDGYYTEQRRAAELVGLDPATVPGSAAEVAGYYEEIRPELVLTRDSAEAALFLSAPPLPYKLGLTPARLAYSGIAALAVGLLPPWARRLYGLPGLPTTDLSAALSTRALRGLLATVPRRLYASPVYRAAMSRAAVSRAAVSRAAVSRAGAAAAGTSG